MEPKYSHGTISVVFKIKKKNMCVLVQYSLFRGVCVDDRSTEPRSWEQGLLFVISPALCLHKKAMFL